MHEHGELAPGTVVMITEPVYEVRETRVGRTRVLRFLAGDVVRVEEARSLGASFVPCPSRQLSPERGRREVTFVPETRPPDGPGVEVQIATERLGPFAWLRQHGRRSVKNT